MKYQKAMFRIECAPELLDVSRDVLVAVVVDAGFESFVDAAYGVDGYVQASLLDEDLLHERLAAFPVDGVRVSYSLEQMPDEDWNAEWERMGFAPIDIDGRLVIVDANNMSVDALPIENIPMPIYIAAREAFGTGTHETTRMIVRALLDMDLRGKRVLDCGCGTGILSIVAMRLGARPAVAYDIDGWSVANARHNARLNGVVYKKVLLGDSSVIEGRFDVVMANINRNILLADIASFVSAMDCGATLLLSGFYEEDVPLLADEAARCGLAVVQTMVDNHWAMMKLRKG